MENINKSEVLSLNNLKHVFGGFDDRPTEIKDNDGQLKYTDVHHDNDNDEEWSEGDTFTIKKVS